MLKKLFSFLPLTIFLSYIAKILYFGATIYSAPIIWALGSVVILYYMAQTIEFGTKRYMYLKGRLATENNFRAQVIEDMKKLKLENQAIMAQLQANPRMNPMNLPGRKGIGR